MKTGYLKLCGLSIFLFVYLCFTTNFFNFWGYTAFILKRYWLIHTLFLWAIFFFSYHYGKLKSEYMGKYALFFAIFPYFVAFLKPLHAEGSIDYEIGTCFDYVTVFVFFFFFYKCKFSERYIVRLIVAFGIATFLVQVYQQLNPRMLMFGVDFSALENTDDLAFVRNGLYRFRIGSSAIQMFCLLYYWDRLLRKLTFLNVLMVLVFSVSIYLYLTRQVLIAGVGAMGIMFLREIKLKKSIWPICVAVLVFFLLLHFWDALFSDFIADYKEDSYTTDIRQEAVEFVLPKIFENPITILFGHGHQLVERTSWNARGYYMSDIGFFGQAYYYGIIWVIVLYTLCYKILFKSPMIPLYIKMFVLCWCITSPMIYPFTNKPTVFVWTCVLYIVSLYKNKERI